MNFLSFQRIVLGLLLCGVMFCNTMLAQNNPLDSVQLVAQREHKRILLYFSGSDWCGPCIKFKQNIIHNSDFQAYAKENLILLNADFPRKKANRLTKEKTLENELLAEKYNPKGLFPCIILLNADGAKLREWNAMPKESPEEFIRLIQN